MGIKIGAWDCNKCGHKKIYGLTKKCTQCNSSRPDDVLFYLPEDSEYVTDEKIIAEAEAGADWICSYCESHNSSTEIYCQSCGNDRNKKEDKSIQEIEYGIDETPTENNKNNQNKAGSDSKATDNKSRNKFANLQNMEAFEQQNHAQGLKELDKEWFWAQHQLKGFYVLIGLLVIGVIIALLAIKRDINLEVAGFEWTRNIYTEEYKEVKELGWSLPATARLISSQEAIDHYDRVADGYETKTRIVRVANGTERYKCGSTSKGNGSFKDKYCTKTTYTSKTETYQDKKYKQVPVYRTQYSYWIYKWVSAASITTTAKDKNPYWGDTSNFNSLYREIKRDELYSLELINAENHSYAEKINFNEWQNIQLHQKMIGKINLFGGFCGLKK
jgi:hypothetical protein